MRTHLRNFWHYHLALYAAIALIAVLLLGYATSQALARGGYRPAPLPPPIHVIGGAPTPNFFTLDPWVVRIHYQAASSSCVGQTSATIMEIVTNRHVHPHGRKHGPAFSSGFVWNQVNGGRDQGITYQAACGILTTQGDATLRAFPPDGADRYWVQPSRAVIAGAYAHRVSDCRSISPYDVQTIKTEIYNGRPIAIAIPVTDSYYNLFNSSTPATTPIVASQYGAFHFYHSITGIGWTKDGLETIGSWGPNFGRNGRVILTWSFIAAVNAEIVVPDPYFPPRTHRRHT